MKINWDQELAIIDFNHNDHRWWSIMHDIINFLWISSNLQKGRRWVRKKTWENCRWRVMKCDGWRAANHHKKPPLFSSPHFSPEIALLPQWFTKNIISPKKQLLFPLCFFNQCSSWKKLPSKNLILIRIIPQKKRLEKIWISKFCVDIGGFLTR